MNLYFKLFRTELRNDKELRIEIDGLPCLYLQWILCQKLNIVGKVSHVKSLSIACLQIWIDGSIDVIDSPDCKLRLSHFGFHSPLFSTKSLYDQNGSE